MRTAKRVRLAGLKASSQLGSARYDIAPGASKTLKVKLATGSRRLAGRNGRLKVRAVASTGASGKIAQSSRRLTLALATALRRSRLRSLRASGHRHSTAVAAPRPSSNKGTNMTRSRPITFLADRRRYP